MGASLAVAGGALTLSGCGSGSSSSTTSSDAASAAAPHTTTLASGQTLVEAADHTDQTSGYRMTATVKVNSSAGSVTADMSGVVSDQGRSVALSSKETVAGTTFDLQLRAAGGKYYMSGIPGLSKLSDGKRWVSFDVADAEKAEGLTGLQDPTTSNPAEYLKYLRSVGSVSAVGTPTINGVRTTEYRATIDLDRYAGRLPAAQQAAARSGIATLEKVIGTHTLPVTAWIGADHEIRRMQLTFPECIEGEQLTTAMTMDLSDYGDVPAVSVPPAADTHDLTSLITAQAGKLKTAVAGGCAGS